MRVLSAALISTRVRASPVPVDSRRLRFLSHSSKNDWSGRSCVLLAQRIILFLSETSAFLRHNIVVTRSEQYNGVCGLSALRLELV